jgi:hypothetical protein
LVFTVVEIEKTRSSWSAGRVSEGGELVGDDCYEPLRAALLQQQQHIATHIEAALMACIITSVSIRDDDVPDETHSNPRT